MGTSSATSELKTAMRVRPSITRINSAVTPATADATSISPGLVTTSHAFCTARPDASTPSRSGSWPSTMFTAMPVRKPSITE